MWLFQLLLIGAGIYGLSMIGSKRQSYADQYRDAGRRYRNGEFGIAELLRQRNVIMSKEGVFKGFCYSDTEEARKESYEKGFTEITGFEEYANEEIIKRIREDRGGLETIRQMKWELNRRRILRNR